MKHRRPAGHKASIGDRPQINTTRGDTESQRTLQIQFLRPACFRSETVSGRPDLPKGMSGRIQSERRHRKTPAEWAFAWVSTTDALSLQSGTGTKVTGAV